ncbi:hypothetical protein LguiA_025909 [Lonicera macranthoides]
MSDINSDARKFLSYVVISSEVFKSTQSTDYRIDELDKEGFMCKYTLLETDAFMDKLESITYEVKFEPYGDTGCVCKISSEYKTRDNVEMKEQDIEPSKDRAIGMYEVVEAYLLAHPHAYT